MTFYVVLLTKTSEATKASKSSFYVTADNAEAAIKKAKEMLKPYETCVDPYFATRTDGSTLGNGCHYMNPKYMKLFANSKRVLAELIHLVRLLEPLEKSGELNVPGLSTLNGAREAINDSL